MIATFSIALPFFLIAEGERYVTSSLAALLIAADPLFIVVLALRFDASERASPWRLLGLCIGFVGVAALVGLSLTGDPLEALGAAMVLGAALCYAVGALLVKRLAGIAPIGASAVTMTIASLVLLPFAAFSVPQTLPSPPVLASVIALGLVCTALAYVIYYSLIQEAGATRASLITYVNPAVAVILGVLILGEPGNTRHGHRFRVDHRRLRAVDEPPTDALRERALATVGLDQRLATIEPERLLDRGVVE